MTWDDDLRTIKTAILSAASNCEQLEAFQRFFKLNSVFKADETEWLTENLSIFPGNLIYEHYEADTEGRQGHATSLLCLWLVLHVLSLWCFIAMVSEDLFDNLTAKGINLHQCKRKI